MSETNFDKYLEEQLRDSDFRARFEQAGKEWDLAIQLAACRAQAGLSQKDLARRVGTTQQQISRLESPDYRGHSFRMVRKVAEALGVDIVIGFRPKPANGSCASHAGRSRATAARRRGGRRRKYGAAKIGKSKTSLKG